MTERKYNPDDPGFLLSQMLDGELSTPGTAKLGVLLSKSAALEIDRAELSAVRDLLASWGSQQVNIDWDSHLALINASVREENESRPELRQVDALLNQWAGSAPKLDIHASVMARIAPKKTARPIRWAVRLGLPLAAAAAIAITVLPLRHPSTPIEITETPLAVVSFGPTFTASATLSQLTVQFERAESIHADSQSDVGFIVVGSPPTRVVEEAAPL